MGVQYQSIEVFFAHTITLRCLYHANLKPINPWFIPICANYQFHFWRKIIGTASHNSRGQRKVSSDDTSSRCFSPSLKNETIDEMSDNEKDMNDNYEEDELADLPLKSKKRMKQLGDSKFGSLKSLKKALSKKSLFKSKKREDSERFPR